ncbi:hypothetical protein CEXT_775281 [Caerostris extrusa]|uniref:Reverse transcriptase/retrotransposon-derived protein RNase H-like domain-containing protein n=1 Tax=Caerostris extrusa TaxID=172846 RepID=A0AAV4MJJ0_CAEEX|nr:hypothetical protein CEXT_775281 [Caerostris extrusa]
MVPKDLETPPLCIISNDAAAYGTRNAVTYTSLLMVKEEEEHFLFTKARSAAWESIETQYFPTRESLKHRRLESSTMRRQVKFSVAYTKPTSAVPQQKLVFKV